MAAASSGAPPAVAHDTSGPEADAHAAEHAAIRRAVARFDRLPASRRRQIRRQLVRPSTDRGARRAAAQDPAVVGKWTSAPFAAPDYAINVVLLRGGRVLLFSMGSGHNAANGDQSLGNDGQATIWDPSLGEGTDAFTEVDPPPIPLDDPLNRASSTIPRPAPIFCAGQVQLADGRVLIAGGNLDLSGGGMRTLFLFDPVAETWVREADMVRRRWYPTVTRMPDGRAAIVGGLDASHGDANSLELYPGKNELVPGLDDGALLAGLHTEETKARRNGGVYPSDFVLPSGRLAASYGGTGMIGLFEPTTGRWVERTPGVVVYGSYPTAFLRPGTQDGPREIEQIGGLRSVGGQEALSAAGFVVDPEREQAWRTTPSLNVARRNAASVLLPDGSAVVVNGGGGSLRFDMPNGVVPTNVPQRQVELWNPATGVWSLGPASVVPRAYHSTALLLPDGRVMAGGDDLVAAMLDTNRADHLDSTMEIYSPPYLFRGSRPQITAAPATAGYASQLEVTATAERPIVRATLMAPGSMTHSIDMNQRMLELPISALGGGRYSVTGPTSSGAAPPGDYMLFMVDDHGVPSVASWVRIRPSGPGNGTPVLTVLSGEEPPPAPTTPGPTTPLSTTPVATTPTTPATPDPEPTTADAAGPPVSQAEQIQVPPEIVIAPPRILPPASTATLQGRVVKVGATMTLSGAVCPGKVTVRVTVQQVVVERRIAARALQAASGATVCRVLGTLTLKRQPKVTAVVRVRLDGKGVQTLKLQAARA